MFDDKFLPNLSQNLLEILDDDEYYDITIEVGNEPHIKTFLAHTVILNYRSPYLQRILSTNKDIKNIKLPNILPEIFQIILCYIYSGRLSLEEYEPSIIVKILVAASEFSLQELIPHLQSFLIKNEANWMEQNFNLIYQTSFENNSFLELQKYCTDLISKEPEKIFNSPDFISIPEKLLISLIQSDNLQMTAFQVWEHVLKWGLAQNPELPSDPTNLSKKEDFNTLKNILQQCILYIDFYDLTSTEFYYKVYPYKKVLPKKLKMDLLKTFLKSNSNSTDEPRSRITNEDREIKQESQVIETKEESRVIKDYIQLEEFVMAEEIQEEPQMTKKSKVMIQSEPQITEKIKVIIQSEPPEPPEPQITKEINPNVIDSKVITPQHAELISKWIDKLEITDESTSSYEFKLLIRGSRDGFSPKKFHEICDNQSCTVTVIKVKGSNEILGGYNPIVWRSGNSYGTPSDSFIFSFKNRNSIGDYILSRVKNEQSAILNSSLYGPSFGNGDLTLFGNNFYNQSECYCKRNSYENQIREGRKFSVEEYEVHVFQVNDNYCSIV